MFVFLPGTCALPASYTALLKVGAGKGWHTIGLDYPSNISVGSTCASSVDPNCFWDVRREFILGSNPNTGTGYSMDVSVAPADAIVVRLAKTLTYLAVKYPSEGWGQYLSGSAINWARVVVGGHSQGGGHAAVMTKLFSMYRACYFDSPADWNLSTAQPAAWASYPDLTPTARQFGFTDLQDTLVPYAQLQPIWDSMGLLAWGAPVSVDTTPTPYYGSHMLTTNVLPAVAITPSSLHGATVVNGYTPMVGNSPLFAPVWTTMCFSL